MQQLGLFLLLACCAVISAHPSVNNHNLTPRIINSNFEDYFPYYVKLTAYDHDITALWRGSGTFVSRRHILTSATFVKDMGQLKISYGSSKLSNLEDTIVYNYLLETYTYEYFNPTTFEDDIAMIILPENINHESVIPALIVRDFVLPDNLSGYVAGFGYSQNGTQWQQNQERTAFLASWISHEQCIQELGPRADVVAGSHFCARDTIGVASVCHGDLGAGFVMEIDGRPYLVGVLSVVTNMCNPSIPAMYTRVTQYTDWIDQIMDL